MESTKNPVTLILCKNSGEFLDATDRVLTRTPRLCTAAIIAEPEQLAPLKFEYRSIGFSQWADSDPKDSGEPLTQDSGESDRSAAMCVYLEGSSNEPAARQFSRLTGRLAIAMPDFEEASILGLLEDEPRSITFILTLGEKREWKHTYGCLLTAIRHVRDVPVPPWGCIAAPNLGMLSILTVKLAFQDRVVPVYAAQPIGLIDTITNNTDAVLEKSPGASVARIDSRQAYDSSHGWNALIFNGHGRGYCACHGYLCGARGMETAPSEPVSSCIHGLECAKSDFGRRDARELDTPLLIMDSCRSIRWDFELIDGENLPTGFSAVLGTCAAVIASDIVPSAPPTVLDILWALHGSETLGAVVERLNFARREKNPPMPFCLVGDPEGPSPRGTLGISEVDLEQSTGNEWKVHPKEEKAAVFRIPLPNCESSREADRDWWFLSARAKITQQFMAPEGEESGRKEIWVHLERTPESRAGLVLSRAAPRRFPSELISRAKTMLASLPYSQGDLQQARIPLLNNVFEVLGLDHSFTRNNGKLYVGTTEGVSDIIDAALESWKRGQRESLESLSQLRPELGWPFQLTTTRYTHAEPLDRECPNCGVPGLIRKMQLVGEAEERENWICVRCCIVRDYPVELTGLEIRLRAAAGGPDSAALLEFKNSLPSERLSITGLVSIEDRIGIFQYEPPLFEFDLSPGETVQTRVKVSIDPSLLVEQYYFLRTIVLASGAWVWASCPVIVRKSEDGAGASMHPDRGLTGGHSHPRPSGSGFVPAEN